MGSCRVIERKEDKTIYECDKTTMPLKTVAFLDKRTDKLRHIAFKEEDTDKYFSKNGYDISESVRINERAGVWKVVGIEEFDPRKVLDKKRPTTISKHFF